MKTKNSRKKLSEKEFLERFAKIQKLAAELNAQLRIALVMSKKVGKMSDSLWRMIDRSEFCKMTDSLEYLSNVKDELKVMVDMTKPSKYRCLGK